MSTWMNFLPYKRGFASSPIAVDISLTDDCNLRCAYCVRRRESKESSPPVYMDPDRIPGLLDDLSRLTPKPFIRLFGGEPFLHPNWEEIVRCAKVKGLWCTSVTNGTLLEEQAQRLVDSGLLAVGVSLDGHAGIQDATRGRATFERVMTGLNALRREKQNARSLHPVVEIYATVHPGNVEHLHEFAVFLEDKDIVCLRLQHLIWCTRRQFEETRHLVQRLYPGEPVLEDDAAFCREGPPPVDPVEFLRQKRMLEEQSWPFKIEFHPSLSEAEWPAFLTESACGQRNFAPCKTIGFYAYIQPSGSLRPCLSVDMGNVFHTPFGKLWNASRMRAFRRLVRSHGRLPVCARCPD